MIRSLVMVLFLCAISITVSAQEKGLKAVVLTASKSAHFDDVIAVAKKELRSDCRLTVLRIDAGDSHLSFDAWFNELQTYDPSLLIALDNKAIELVKQLQREKKSYAHVPAIAAMGINLGKSLEEYPYICGISYEVAPLSILTKFKQATNREPRHVLTFYRPSFNQAWINEAREHLKREGIELTAIDVEHYGQSQRHINLFLQRKLLSLVSSSKYDAVLVPLDNRIVNRQSMARYWLPAARRVHKPFMSGIEAFVSPDLNFCAFAAFPDTQGLGVQLADLVFRVAVEHEPVKGLGVEHIVAIDTKVDPTLLK
jgi:ABC-type uncharacterized transport system substrate-binding protein